MMIYRMTLKDFFLIKANFFMKSSGMDGLPIGWDSGKTLNLGDLKNVKQGVKSIESWR